MPANNLRLVINRPKYNYFSTTIPNVNTVDNFLTEKPTQLR